MLKWIGLMLMATFIISQADEVIIGYCNCEEPVTTKSTTMAPDYYRACFEILKYEDAESGDYIINPTDGGEAFRVYCDMDTDGGGWTVFQRRVDGSVNFNRGWSDYKSGFGDVTGEHWLGNDKIYQLISLGNTELMINLTTAEDELRYARYGNFKIDDEDGKYTLRLSNYSGDAYDALAFTNNWAFSTFDEDNDGYSGNCAESAKGGWWYDACSNGNLNGLYSSHFTWYNRVKTSEMKMRKL